ncbi:MAG: aminotransferase class I/II-fold pyridoxal phosphate-dependent enzyme [Bryobacteraceae bacterium]|nr:aminotransferase class I/II-fold pyridoxal phosphate-dependent enzyme [Bryobacteraceae bacterium]
MITRRLFSQTVAAGVGAASWWTEAALAQRAAVEGDFGPDTAWLNANENPEGPCPAALEAMSEALAATGRYHYQEYRGFVAEVARSEGLEPEQILVGAGSSEILQTAVFAFTSPTRPLIFSDPTFELPMGIARALSHRMIRCPLTPTYASDVRLMVEQAAEAGGGLIYLCNPNNPTSTITPKADIAWLAANLPPDTVAMIDEAYIHFSDDPELESAIGYVCQGKDVLVTRTFSKIYGMAGLRVGFGCARPDLIGRMASLRSNVVSYVSSRAVLASLRQLPDLLAERRGRFAAIRADLCDWLREREVRFLTPHANFVMIDVKRNVREVIPALVRRGVAPGRAFPPLTNMLRVSIGTPADMDKFKRAFAEVYAA